MLKRMSLFLIVLSLLQPQHLKAHEAEEHSPRHTLFAPSIYSKIANELLTSSHDSDSSSESESGQLTEAQKRTILLKLFSEFSLANFQSNYPVISTDDIRKDLEFFNQANLYNRLKRTTTAFGDVVFARHLAEPTSDINELTRRQAVVKKLLEDEELFTTWETALTEIKKAEPVLLSFFSAQNELQQQLLSSLYFDKVLWGDFPGYSDEWDKNEKALLVTEVAQKSLLLWQIINFASLTTVFLENGFSGKVLGTTWAAVALLRFNPELFKKIAGPAVLVGMGWLVYHYSGHLAAQGRGIFQGVPFPSTQPAQPASPSSFPEHVPLLEEPRSEQPQASSQQGQSQPGLLDALGQLPVIKQLRPYWAKYNNFQKQWKMWEMAAVLPLSLYNDVRIIYVWNKRVTILHKKLQRLARSVRKMRHVSSLLSQNEELMAMIPEVAPLMNVFERGGGSEDMTRLLTMLESDTFKGDISIRSHFGRIAATNKLMNSTKYDWVEIFEAIGYLDVYLSTAKLMKEFQDKKITYCFADYVKSDTPSMILEDFWDPFLNVDQAVPNSLSLADPTRNILLTGPNTGGKSTVIKGTMLTTLCAQTLGIAPAHSCSMTPFSAFNTYIRVEDDIEHGFSLFASEVRRANLLKQKIARLPKHEFGLTIIDEMFRGTAPENAEELSYNYAIDFGNSPNSICLMATHYPKLIKLEDATQGKYHNYKVEIEKLPNGKIKRNYKLVRGFTTQNVALDILKEQGLIS